MNTGPDRQSKQGEMSLRTATSRTDSHAAINGGWQVLRYST